MIKLNLLFEVQFIHSEQKLGIIPTATMIFCYLFRNQCRALFADMLKPDFNTDSSHRYLADKICIGQNGADN